MKSRFKFSLYFYILQRMRCSKNILVFNKDVVLTKTSSGRRMVNEKKNMPVIHHKGVEGGEPAM